MNLCSPITDAVIANGETVSAVADLGAPYKNLVVRVPDMTTAVSVTVQVSFDNVTFATLQIVQDDGTTADIVLTESKAFVLNIGGIRYVKVTANAGVGAEATIEVVGCD